MKKTLSFALILATILLSACNKETDLIVRGIPKPEPTYNTYNLKNEHPDIFFAKTATIKAQNSAIISSEIAGRIIKVNVKNGQTVKKGDILVTLGDSLSTDIQAEQNAAAEQGLYLSYESEYITNELAETSLNSLKTALDNAQSNLYKAKDALKKGTSEQKDQLENAEKAARQQYQSAISQYKQANISQDLQLVQLQNQINQAELNKTLSDLSAEKKYVRSPINGVISSLSAEVGNLTGPGQPIAQIANDAQQIIKIGLNSEEASYIKIGDNVTIEDISNTAHGTITSINKTLDQLTKKHTVEIKVDKATLTTGDLINVIFTANTDKLFIPLNSVLLEDGEKTVKILNNNVAEKIAIKTGSIFSNYIQVTSGLKGSEEIVISYNNN